MPRPKPEPDSSKPKAGGKSKAKAKTKAPASEVKPTPAPKNQAKAAKNSNATFLTNLVRCGNQMSNVSTWNILKRTIKELNRSTLAKSLVPCCRVKTSSVQLS